MKQEMASQSEIHDAIAHLQRLSDIFEHRRRQLAREVGLTVNQWAVIENISDEHFMPSMFAEAHGASPQSVSNTLRQLQDKGLVTVAIAEGDKRRHTCRLTQKGRRAMEKIRAARERAIGAVWGDLDPRKMRGFTDFSADLIGRLEKHAKSEE